MKVVVQAIPTFAMSCFKLPMGLRNDIEAMIRNFGGVKGVIGGRFIGKNGILSANQNLKGGWVLENWESLMMLC